MTKYKCGRFLSAICSVAITALVFSASALAQQSKPAQIQVQGSGSASVTPDAFTVTFVLEQKGETVSKLNTQLQHHLNQLTDFLLEQDVPAKQIQSMQVRLAPWYENAREGRKQQGFILTREISVTHNHIEHYDRIIDGALKRGVTRISQFDLISQDQQNAFKQALINAIRDAKSKAALIAGELDVNVGDVIDVTQQYGGRIMTSSKASMAMADESGSMPGQQQIEANVSVTFALN
ncbi:SIMPL domain-containing protein [Salinimonas chungwhensis]|uniref:SIMPL domain-containing protein n=1 Tax=Salinimonas chungwhensis TaxID=265425 RepID=UPI00037E160A|nr:SIMPL domain-containing protein [Salinimonas chungwhensis]